VAKAVGKRKGLRMENTQDEKAATILVIDDEEMVRMALSNGLARAGYAVLEAADGERGLDLFRKRMEEIDLVILDLVLPEQWGDEIFPQLQELKPGVKVVVYTGFTVQENEFEDVQAVLSKPVTIEKMIRTLKVVLGEE
jgi:two-component system, cell cycle sensor histidine kinase and response regulator CckA